MIDDDDRPALSARARKSPLAPEVINSYSIGSLRTIIHLTFSALAPHDHDHDHAPRYVHAHIIIQDDGVPEHLEERVSCVARTRTQIHDDRYCETRRGPKDGAERGTEEGEEGLEERTGRILSIAH